MREVGGGAWLLECVAFEGAGHDVMGRTGQLWVGIAAFMCTVRTRTSTARSRDL